MRPLILGCLGTQLSHSERNHFRAIQPLGFILLARNCHSPQQTMELISSLKECVDHTDVPILIDQEGGRVQRLNAWCHFPPAQAYSTNPKQLPTEVGRLSRELQRLAINVNCAPCCDLTWPDCDPIIGDRSLGSCVENVVLRASEWIRVQSRFGITSVIKHMPGHGRAKSDSHIVLPVVDASREALQHTDMNVFYQLTKQHPYAWGMTAHIVYPALDPHNLATFSPIIIQKWIRDWMGFQGLLLSDCLYMRALSGPLEERARRALRAGCDIILFCTIAHMRAQSEVSKGCPFEDTPPWYQRVSRALTSATKEHEDGTCVP